MADDVDFRKTVAGVVAIIGRDKARVDEIERAIRSARRLYDFPLPTGPQNKTDKRAARSIAAALGKLEKTLGYAKNEWVAYRATSKAHEDFCRWKAQLEEWRKYFEAFAGDLRTDGAQRTFLPPAAEGWPLGHKNKATEKLIRKRRAVEAAAHLLASHDLPLSVTRISGTCGGSDFCRVAAVLYGERRADLSYQCSVHKARKRGPK